MMVSKNKVKNIYFWNGDVGGEHENTTAVVTMAPGYVVSGTRGNYMWKRTHCWSYRVDFQFFDLQFC